MESDTPSTPGPRPCRRFRPGLIAARFGFGNFAPGQAFSFGAAGSSGPQPTPRNGSVRYTVTTVAPSAPAGSCPNPKWTASVTDVAFTGMATITLSEDGVVSDSVTVP